MLFRLTFVVLAVGVGSMFRSVDAGVGVGSEVVIGNYGVKLCGREFIRAVIYTCGGSRWKRSLGEEFDPFQVSSYIDVNKEDNRQTSRQHDLETDALSALPVSPSSHSLADLLSLFGAIGDPREPADDQDQRQGFQQDSPGVAEQEGNSHTDSTSTPDKRKRNFNLGMAGMCCSQGCTKQDIGHLC